MGAPKIYYNVETGFYYSETTGKKQLFYIKCLFISIFVVAYQFVPIEFD